MAHEKKSTDLPPETAFDGLPKKVTELLEKESDRGAILILAAYIEEILGFIVRASCTSDKLGKELLQFRKPAGDFSSKITLCEAFGLISPDEAKALHCLRKTRNNAAHFDQKGRGFDVLFDSPQTVEQIKSFCGFLNLKLESDEADYVRDIFIVSGRLLATKLVIRLFLATRPDAAKSVKEMANVFRTLMKDTERGKAMADAEKQAREGDPEKLFELIQTTVNSFKELASRITEDSTASSEPEAE